MGPTCMAAAGEDSPTPHRLSVLAKRTLAWGVGWEQLGPRNLLRVWGPQMGGNEVCVLLGVPSVGGVLPTALASLTFLPQYSFLLPSSSGGSLPCYFPGLW